MCGINGIYSYHYAANPIDRDELVKTRDHMAARGPDGSGQWIATNDRVGFGHRRLSIIDLTPAGAQPMASPDGKLVVTFNGEIYNYRELRHRLEGRGCIFQSQSDTEVLLHLYAEKGPGMVGDLRGMFAFAIWDENRRSLFLARDPYGIKPLYYADDGWTFRFASQVKALLAGGAIATESDPAGVAGFYLFGSVPEPFTIRRDIRALPAGCTMLVDRIGGHEPQRYFSIAAVYREAELSDRPRPTDPAARQALVREALRDSVRHHLVADVPVGAFLSGGIDSGAIIGLMRDAGQSEIKTVTLTFEEFRGCTQDEAPLASELAKFYGTNHTTRMVREREFDLDLPKILACMDQPSIDGINTWFAAKAAHELGLKVVLSGLGGDELFGGYPSFRDIPRWVNRLSFASRLPLVGRLSRILAPPFVDAAGFHPKAAGLLEMGGTYAGAYLLRRGVFLPSELSSLMGPELARVALRRLAPLRLIDRELTPRLDGTMARMSALESGLYMKNQLLRDTDWASMAHNIEVRIPLVDHVLLSKMAHLPMSQPGADSKSDLATAPSRPLPASVASRSKTGFATPIALWQRNTLAGSAGPVLKSKKNKNVPWARSWARHIAAA